MAQLLSGLGESGAGAGTVGAAEAAGAAGTVGAGAAEAGTVTAGAAGEGILGGAAEAAGAQGISPAFQGGGAPAVSTDSGLFSGLLSGGNQLMPMPEAAGGPSGVTPGPSPYMNTPEINQMITPEFEHLRGPPQESGFWDNTQGAATGFLKDKLQQGSSPMPLNVPLAAPAVGRVGNRVSPYSSPQLGNGFQPYSPFRLI